MLSLIKNAMDTNKHRSVIRYMNQNAQRMVHHKSRNSSYPVHPPFKKILIANRGEIACRIIKTAKKLNVKTVAVYSDPDAKSMHVDMADEAYHIGKASSKESYLNMDKIIEIAKYSNAEAIHPGYGFLSENALFVDKVEAAGLVFIGPSSYPMRQMGDKINSKKIAENAGCYIIPGYQGEVKDDKEAVHIANKIGYPVMIKASAGGGGKGMRIAYNESEVEENFKMSKSEALSSFGDDRMLIERYIEEPHHIEIQVLADSHGNVTAFPERECSVQRRNQKVVEESPSCLLSLETREKMQRQAIMLCKAVNYRSAGTIEMLADKHQNFFFLEMNTRLQVEHPVTELVTGEDLVEHMLWIAAGSKLPDRLLTHTDEHIFVPISHNSGSSRSSSSKKSYRYGLLNPSGWALESRVYAEDAIRGFLPSIGPLISYIEPTSHVQLDSHGLSILPPPTSHTTASSSSSSVVATEEYKGITRIDTGVRGGDTITMYYDPMISKLCTYATTREQAIVLMETAIDEYTILPGAGGVISNLNFLRSIFRNANFRAGNYSTKFIPQEYPHGFTGSVLSAKESYEMLTGALMFHLSIHNNHTLHRHRHDKKILNSVYYIGMSNPAHSSSDDSSQHNDYHTKFYKVSYNTSTVSYKWPEVPHTNSTIKHELYPLHITFEAVDATPTIHHAHTHKSSTSTSTSHHQPQPQQLTSTDMTTTPTTTAVENNVNTISSVLYEITVLSFDWPLHGPLAYLQYYITDVPPSPNSNSKSSKQKEKEIIQFIGRDSQIHTSSSSHSSSSSSSGSAGDVYYCNYHGNMSKFEIRTPLEHSLARYILPAEKLDTTNLILCPMPGNLVSLSVKKGDHVERGQAICTVEAMKMQNIIRASKKGKIKEVKRKVGENLQVDDIIVEYA